MLVKESLNVAVAGCPSLSATGSGSSTSGEVVTGAELSEATKPRRTNVLPVLRTKAPSVVSVGLVQVSVITSPLRVA
jgi:hypothetical protein